MDRLGHKYLYFLGPKVIMQFTSAIEFLLIGSICALGLQLDSFSRFQNHDRKLRYSFRMSASSLDSNLLVRALRGEDVERTPVWLMRQAHFCDLLFTILKS
jgi:hypothetical protein